MEALLAARAVGAEPDAASAGPFRVGPAKGEQEPVLDDDSGRLLGERANAPGPRVDQPEAGRRRPGFAVLDAVVVEPRDCDMVLPEPASEAARALDHLRLGLGLEPVPDAPEERDRLGELVVEDALRGDIDLRDRAARGHDDRPSSVRREGETRRSLTGGVAFFGVLDLLEARADLGEGNRVDRAVGLDEGEPRGADRAYRAEQEGEAPGLRVGSDDDAVERARRNDAALAGVDRDEFRILAGDERHEPLSIRPEDLAHVSGTRERKPLPEWTQRPDIHELEPRRLAASDRERSPVGGESVRP